MMEIEQTSDLWYSIVNNVRSTGTHQRCVVISHVLNTWGTCASKRDRSCKHVFRVPSSSETWQWKVQHIDDFAIKNHIFIMDFPVPCLMTGW